MKYNDRVIKGIYKRIVGTMSGLADIKVEIHPEVVPHYEVGKKTIRMPSGVSYAQNEEEEFLFARGIVVHEAGHVLFVPKITGSLRRQEDKDFWEWFNVFADVNNEFKTAKVFPNLGKPLADKTEALFKTKPQMLENPNPFLQVLMRTDKLSTIPAKYPDDMNPDLKEFVEDIVKRFNKRRIHSCKGSKLIDFTQEVYEDWRKVKAKHENQCNPNAAKIKELMEQMSEKIKSGGSEEEIQKLEKEIDGLSKCKEQWFEDSPVRPANASKQDFDNLSDESLKKIIEKVKKLSKEELDKKIESANQGMPPDTEVIEQRNPEGVPYKLPDIKRAHSKGKLINRMLKRRIKLQEDFEKRHRNGYIIDSAEVRKQIARAGRLTNAQVFERENTLKEGGEWAIEILIDCSGSMDGYKMDMAKQALATLAYAIDGLPSVHWALTGFDCDSTPRINEWQIKKFTDAKFKIERLKRIVADGGTPTSHIIKSSARRLLKFQRLKKMMVVITDGEPADKKATKEMVKLISPRINVLGIGIEGINEKSMANLFPTHYMFNKSSANLEKDLTNLILEALDQKERIKSFKRTWEL